MDHEEVERRARAGEGAARRREGDEARGAAGLDYEEVESRARAGEGAAAAVWWRWRAAEAWVRWRAAAAA